MSVPLKVSMWPRQRSAMRFNAQCHHAFRMQAFTCDHVCACTRLCVCVLHCTTIKTHGAPAPAGLATAASTVAGTASVPGLRSRFAFVSHVMCHSCHSYVGGHLRGCASTPKRQREPSPVTGGAAEAVGVCLPVANGSPRDPITASPALSRGASSIPAMVLGIAAAWAVDFVFSAIKRIPCPFFRTTTLGGIRRACISM